MSQKQHTENLIEVVPTPTHPFAISRTFCNSAFLQFLPFTAIVPSPFNLYPAANATHLKGMRNNQISILLSARCNLNQQEFNFSWLYLMIYNNKVNNVVNQDVDLSATKVLRQKVLPDTGGKVFKIRVIPLYPSTPSIPIFSFSHFAPSTSHPLAPPTYLPPAPSIPRLICVFPLCSPCKNIFRLK